MLNIRVYIHIFVQAFLKTVSIIGYLFIEKTLNMRVDKLRAIFEDSQPELIPQQSSEASLLEELMKDDLVKVNTAVIAVQHFMTLANIYSVRYPDTFEQNFPKVQSRSYSKIYTILEEVNLDALFTKEFSLYEDELKVIEYSMESLLNYFETTEEFEKCAKIKAIVDIVKSRETLSNS